MNFLLMSGPTGLLGEYILKDLLLSGWNIAVLCRGMRGIAPADRVEDLLRNWEERLGFALPRPVVIESDLTEPYLGVGESELKWIRRNCNAFLHNAASLTFEANREDGEPWLSNLTGTQNAIQLCQRSHIENIFHVSTAYVCGRRSGCILESEADLGQSFATEYEASKCASELEWKNRVFRNLTILRPAIIVGDSETGYTSTYHGFYAPLKSMAMLLSQGSRTAGLTSHETSPSFQIPPVPLEPMLGALGLSGSEEKNFVPVDWVSRVISAVVSTPAAWNQTYHITPDKRVSARDAAEAMQKSLVKHFNAKNTAQSESESNATEGATALSTAALQSHTDDWSQMGKAFSHQVSAYQEYWRDDPTFDARNRLSFVKQHDRSDLDCPTLDSSTLERLCDFALQNGFGWPKKRISPRDDSLESWFEERFVACGEVSAGLILLNALGPNGGKAVVGFDSQRQIVYEFGDDPELPRLTFCLEALRRFSKFSELDARGQVWIQLPQDRDVNREPQQQSSYEETSDYKTIVELADRISDGFDAAKRSHSFVKS